MNALQIDIFGLSIMNNTPIHFFLAAIMLGIFIWAAFFTKEAQKPKARKIMMYWFVLVFLSGGAVWTLVDFSIPLLIKSVGGVLLFWVMLEIVKSPVSKLFWSLFVAIATVGLGLAWTSI